MKSVDLSSFDGLGLLSGVWFTDCPVEDSHYGTAQRMYFMLDGVIYAATEDPDDGYRSTCRDVLIDDTHMPVNIWQPPEEVMCKYIEKRKDSMVPDEWQDTQFPQHAHGMEVVEIVSVKTKKIVLMFGTDHVEDYYPAYIANFTPENMGINEHLANLFGEPSE